MITKFEALYGMLSDSFRSFLSHFRDQFAVMIKIIRNINLFNQHSRQRNFYTNIFDFKENLMSVSLPFATNVACSHMHLYFGSLSGKQRGPRTDCSLRTRLIRVHSTFLHGESF